MLCLASDFPGLSCNRSATNGNLIPASWNTVSYGKRSFHYSAAAVWNKLPVPLRRSDTVANFKKGLKTFLFINAYRNDNLN